MYSKAKIAGHPIHPMLVAFPIAFYTATVVTLIVYAATHDPFWFRASMFLDVAGVVMAVAALIPGTIDLFALPSRSRARSTGYQHAAANLVATAAFVITGIILWRAWYGASLLDVTVPIVVGVIGLVAMFAAGILGMILVRRHHVGVRPTRFVQTAQNLEEIDDLDELPPRPATPDASRPAPVTWH